MPGTDEKIDCLDRKITDVRMDVQRIDGNVVGLSRFKDRTEAIMFGNGKPKDGLVYQFLILKKIMYVIMTGVGLIAIRSVSSVISDVWSALSGV